MGDRIKKIQEKLIEFWNKYDKKQKTIVFSVLGVAIIAIVILFYVTSKTKYETLSEFETTAEASEAKTCITDAGIECRVLDDGKTIEVDKTKIGEARLALGKSGITDTTTKDFMTSLLDNDMSTTESEKQVKMVLYIQAELSESIQTIDGIKNCAVTINIPETSNSIYKTEKEAFASIRLTTTKDLGDDSIYGIASFVANRLGCSGTDNIRIIDQTGALLYPTSYSASASGSSAAIAIADEVTFNMESRVRNLLLNSGVFSDAEVMANLDIDLDEKSIVDTQYYSNDEDETGPMDTEYTYSAENVDGTGGVPGTDSNDGEVTDTDLQDTQYGNSTINVIKKEYSTSSTVTNTEKAIGKINATNSSVAIVLTKYVIYDEETMKDQGLLDGTNFDEFQAANSEKKSVDVDENLYNSVVAATGIKSSNINIMAYEVPVFYPKSSPVTSVTNWLIYGIAGLIVVLLAFVVIKGMKPVEVTELEPELSVEALLATTKENQTLDDIEFSDKSATRQQIEKFVDDNPEAVAQLLRNWLNDEWE